MKIVDYSKQEMSNEVIELFSLIYPHWTEDEMRRIVYDENHKLNVATKVALEDSRFVGQANVFRLPNNHTVGNLGFHVHPNYRRKNVGIGLAAAVIEKAKGSGIKEFVIQTEATNVAAINLAIKLGFVEPSKEFLGDNDSDLKYRRLKNGICLSKK